jgi:hypothetical protein
MMGYTAETIARKAAKRGMEPFEYELYLLHKRQERAKRRRARNNPPKPEVDTPTEA